MSYSSTAFVFKMASMLFALFTGTAHAAGDPERGARDFRPCMACHSVKPGEHSIGPSLATMWNRKAGTVEGFLSYSSGLREANIEWNQENLDKWLSAPQKFIPGTSMNFKGITDAQERADIIAYLKAVFENTAPDIPPQGGMLQKRRRGG
ncbi:c-type cytochrome [Herbaspirillum sp. GCM10030257]|uniref:c-type cytochrome n=1 Tax=Herbaspirillum sp. GCM10030257 TaxID=3273393 RepID=UPI00360DF0AE